MFHSIPVKIYLIRGLFRHIHDLSYFPTREVMDYANISCLNGSSLEKLFEEELCFQYSYFILLSFSILAFAVAISTALCFHYQTEIAVYCYSSRWKFVQQLVTKFEKGDDKIYDAFVSFSHDDEQFVSEILVPELEQNGERKYKLCLHYRDWAPGRMINSQIIDSIQSSRRTIVVLSPGFIKSVWGAMEFKTAHAEGLRNGITKVIVILYKDIGPLERLDKELVVYLKQNTYVKWGSPWFWQQLCYALPHQEKYNNYTKYTNIYFSKRTKRKYSIGIDLSRRSNEVRVPKKKNKTNNASSETINKSILTQIPGSNDLVLNHNSKDIRKPTSVWV